MPLQFRFKKNMFKVRLFILFDRKKGFKIDLSKLPSMNTIPLNLTRPCNLLKDLR